MRIVSLVPSLTRTVCDLGFQNQIVGCTNFCVDPPGLFKEAKFVGGTKDADLNIIKSLKPDLILLHKEENPLELISACEKICSCWTSEITSLDETIGELREVSKYFGDKAEVLANKIEAELNKVTAKIGKKKKKRKPKAIYLIWEEPYFAVGQHTYIDGLLKLMGIDNALVVNGLTDRYPKIDPLDYISSDLFLLSSEPFSFRKRNADKLIEMGCDSKKIWKIDGKLMSWYGSLSLEFLKKLSEFDKTLLMKPFYFEGPI